MVSSLFAACTGQGGKKGMFVQTVLLMLSLVFPALVILGAVNDAATMKIPNRLSMALAALYLPVAFVAGVGAQDMMVSVGLGLAALVVGIALFALRVLGGGDAKLLAASVMWVGLGSLVEFLIFTALAGGALTLFLLGARKWVPLMPVPDGPAWVQRLLEPKGDLPYGVAIAVGAIAIYPQSQLIQTIQSAF